MGRAGRRPQPRRRRACRLLPGCRRCRMPEPLGAKELPNLLRAGLESIARIARLPRPMWLEGGFDAWAKTLMAQVHVRHRATRTRRPQVAIRILHVAGWEMSSSPSWSPTVQQS